MFEQIISLVAPHECLACSKEGDLLCYDCRSRLHQPDETIVLSNLDSVLSAVTYEAYAKDLVARLKFDRAKAAAGTIAAIMAEHIRVEAGTRVMHVPTAAVRARTRGYDQAALIARAFARLKGLRYEPLLCRMGRQRQVGQDKQTRQLQMRGAFRVTGVAKSEGAPIVLIDDVLTTGSTLEAAGHALRQAGFSRVSAATFAVSRKSFG